MQDLNNLIIEGVVKGKESHEEGTFVVLQMYNVESDLSFSVTAIGSIARSAHDSLELGDYLRVVGYLFPDKGGQTVIAEHIERRPKKFMVRQENKK